MYDFVVREVWKIAASGNSNMPVGSASPCSEGLVEESCILFEQVFSGRLSVDIET